jgi:hypothetical protein
VVADAHYGHAFTVTGGGPRGTMLTGAYPHRTGIIGNDWRDPITGELEYCTGDTTATYIGHKTQALDGTSPKNLRVETVGDVLRRATPQSKGDRYLRQGPRRDPACGQNRHGLHVHGQTGQFRVQHVLHESAPGVGRCLQRRQAGRPLFQDRMEAAAARDAPTRAPSPTPSPGSARAAASCP